MGHRTEGTFRTRTILQGGNTHFLAAVHAAEPVGDIHDNPFGPRYHRPDPGGGGGINDLIHRKAGKKLDPFGLEYLGDNVHTAHLDPPTYFIPGVRNFEFIIAAVALRSRKKG